MQNTDSSFSFDDFDFVLPSRCAEKRAAVLAHLFLSKADRLTEEKIGLLDDVLVQVIERLPSGSVVKTGHEEPKRDFADFSKPDAQRLLRYWQVRAASARGA